MSFFDKLTGAVVAEQEKDGDEARAGDPRAQQRVSAKLAAEARQVDRKALPEPVGVLPSDEDQAAALAALAALFVKAREGFDPSTADIPFLGKAHVEVTKSRPVRTDVPGGWSTGTTSVGGSPARTIVGRNIARASLMILNRGTAAVLLSPSPDGPTFEVAPGATFSIDTTGPVYGSSIDGSAQRVQVTQTYHGEGV